MKQYARHVIGHREKVVLVLPGKLGVLRLVPLIAKIDTGADTSALHATSIKTSRKGKRRIVRFKVKGHRYEAKASSRIFVRCSNGKKQRRLCIAAAIRVGRVLRKIRLSLANRERMQYPMLLGRDFLGKGFLVDPKHKFVLSKVKRPGRASTAA